MAMFFSKTARISAPQIALLFGLAIAPEAKAGLEIGGSSNFILAGINNANLKLQTYALFHMGPVAMGPMARYQHFNTEMQESIAGFAVRINTDVYIQLEAGFLQREAFGLTGTGTAAALSIGTKIANHVFLEMPIIYRHIPESDKENTLNGRTQIDFVPMFGVSIGG